MEKKWYVVHTYSGYEQKVKENLEENIKTNKMEELFGEIIVPSEVIMEKVKGQVKKSQRTVFPGISSLTWLMNDDTWYLVRNTPKVTGFVGYDKMNPPPLPDKEVNEIILPFRKARAKLSRRYGLRKVMV